MDTDEEGLAAEARFTRKVSDGRLYYSDASLCSFGKELAATARNERGKSRKRTERGQL